LFQTIIELKSPIRQKVNGICALLRYYTAYSGNLFLDFLTLENGINRLFWKVGEELSLYAA